MKTGKMAVMIGVNQPLEIREYPLTAPRKGMAQLELAASGICGTDIHILKGKIPVHTPMAIGHEFVGRVLAMDEEDSVRTGIFPGDYAVVDIACPCGHCPLCEDGDDANCIHMGVTNGGDPDSAPHFHGGYGEYAYAPAENLIRVPENLDPKMVCIYACAGPTTMHAFSLAAQANCGLEKAKTAVVQGLGPVGTFAILYLKTLGVENIIAVTGRNNEEKKKMALCLGATEVHSVEAEGEAAILARVKEVSGIGADLVFEGSGNPNALAQGLPMLRNRGTYLVPGQYSNSGAVAIPPQLITFNALRILGSSQYSVVDVEAYLAFLSAHPELHDMIRDMAAAYPVSCANQAVSDSAAGKNIKTILVKG